MRYSNKTVLVSGGTRGIGAEIVQQFLDEGATVLATGSSEDSVAMMKERYEKHRAFKAYLLNLGDRDSVLNFLEQIKEEGVQIDIFISNAAINKDALAIQLKVDDWLDMMNVNLNHSVLIAQQILRTMIRNRFGRIVFLSSVVAFSGNKGQSAYCTTKAAIVGFAKSLALEVASRNITVNCIAPGFIQSDMTNKLSEEQKEGILCKIPMQRLGTPADIAHTCLFLCEEKSSYITGQTIHVNGGLYCS